LILFEKDNKCVFIVFTNQVLQYTLIKVTKRPKCYKMYLAIQLKIYSNESSNFVLITVVE